MRRALNHGHRQQCGKSGRLNPPSDISFFTRLELLPRFLSPGDSFRTSSPWAVAPTTNKTIKAGEVPAGYEAHALLATFRTPFYHMVTMDEPTDEKLLAQAVCSTMMAAQGGRLAA